MPPELCSSAGQELSPDRPGQGTTDRGEQEMVAGLPAGPAKPSLEHSTLTA